MMMSQVCLNYQGGTAPTITPAEHKAICVQYSTAFFRAKVRDASPAAADLDRACGPGGLSSSESIGVVLLSYRPAKTYAHFHQSERISQLSRT